ncbi:kinesin-like protein KIF20A [Neosynchiropus ocellatus]
MSSVVDPIVDDNLQPEDMELTCNKSPDRTSTVASESAAAEPQTMSVYLRVRPFSKEELADDEDQDCVVIESSQVVALHAPKGSASMKSSDKGIGTSLHKFSFSKIFGPATTQSDLYEDTVKSQMTDFLDGKNVLLFSYGVTNAGKTFTIQGSLKEPGILPRALGATFAHTTGRQYEAMDLKPHLRNDVQYLLPDKVKQEKSAKAAIFASLKEDCDFVRTGESDKSLSTSSLSTFSFSGDQSAVITNLSEVGSIQFSLWVAFFEIYNECVYDLLLPNFCSKSKKRASLRVCDDGAGNAYIKDLHWINVHSLGEACKLLQFGNKNRSAAATKMNQSSSRRHRSFLPASGCFRASNGVVLHSHSIFTMKLLKIDEGTVKNISEFALCDLAGSERCNKTKTIGERLKEAGNINNSLHILGKCITALRNNQTDRVKSSCIPFRESKLTKLFQSYFCGKGRASMIVNINQCASTYDETLHVMKFSAVAKQVVPVVIPDKPMEFHSPCRVECKGKPLLGSHSIDSPAPDGCLSDEEPLNEDDEADVSSLPHNQLVSMIESLQKKLQAERKRNLVQEMEIRKEMGDAMVEQYLKCEERRRQQIEELKESHQENLESTFQMYKDAIKEHAYQSAMNDLEDDYVPLDEFIAEQEKALTLKLEKLEKMPRGAEILAMEDKSCQTQPSTATEGDEHLRRLYKEKCAIEEICAGKQQLILSLERRLRELNETLDTVREGFLDKSTEVKDLQRKTDEQTRSVEELLHQTVEKDMEIASLKEELSKVTEESPVLKKPKRGILANIREAVTSPRKGAMTRSLRKTVRSK